MKTNISALCAGLIFGLGLLLSGMTNPEKVLGFLDLVGAWDPSLGLVMFSAIAVGLPLFHLVTRRGKSIWNQPLHLPTKSRIDRRLALGSLLFGAGWGLVGLCPGPALVAAGAGQPKALIFVLAMLTGMSIFQLFGSKRTTAAK
ncbi:DUF6691 family protein [Microbulbifer sp. ZKSA006]|uniref:DUF6691 family protein n=1 Tax=Microbulbifer sp. ZKSA006 TaxID=3243390 RepID=UPI004039BFE4